MYSGKKRTETIKHLYGGKPKSTESRHAKKSDPKTLDSKTFFAQFWPAVQQAPYSAAVQQAQIVRKKLWSPKF